MSITLSANAIVLELRGRRARVPCALDVDDLVVFLDDVTHFEAPHSDEEITLEDLQAIAAMIEAECEKREIDLEFD